MNDSDDLSYIYICGYNQLGDSFLDANATDSSVEYRASIGKVTAWSGTVEWLIEGTGSNPDYDGSSILNQDLC